MKNNIDEVAQTIAQTIEKFPADTLADHGTLHHTLKMTKRESEAWLMASWFLKNVEKMSLKNDKEVYNQYRKQLSEKAIEITGK